MAKNFGIMNDKELDRLFREAAEDFKPPSAPEGAWDNFVQTKLSKNKKQQGWLGKLNQKLNTLLPLLFTPRPTWQFALTLTVLAVGIWYGVSVLKSGSNNQNGQHIAQNTNDNQRQGQRQAAEAAAAAKANMSSSGTSQTGSVPALVPNQTSPPNSQTGPTGEQLLAVNASAGAGAETASRPTAPLHLDRNRDNATGLLLQNIEQPNNKVALDNQQQPQVKLKSQILPLTKLGLGTTLLPPVHNQLPDANKDGNATAANKLNNKSNQVKLRPGGDLGFGRAPQTTPALNYKKVAKNTTNRELDYGNDKDFEHSAWQMGVVGGSNLSLVSGTLNKSLGVNTGLMVQKRLNKSRLSVETGVIVEKMDYSVANGDFQPGGNPVSSKVSNITGTCTMIDVPVNVRYDVVHSAKNNAFVSTGMSAMWMAKQSYNYKYTGESGPKQVSKDVTGQGNDVYTATNVSLGFEHRFKKTAVEVAPYVKIPLGSIGYGDLNLGSVGAQILIKQSF